MASFDEALFSGDSGFVSITLSQSFTSSNLLKTVILLDSLNFDLFYSMLFYYIKKKRNRNLENQPLEIILLNFITKLD